MLEGVAWPDLFDHALATQTQVWGGSGNVPFPLVDDLDGSELFWELLDRLDPDLTIAYSPSWSELEPLIPDAYARELKSLETQLARPLEATELHDWRRQALQFEIPRELGELIVRRVAPLHHELTPLTE
jgi:hypothetical protein